MLCYAMLLCYATHLRQAAEHEHRQPRGRHARARLARLCVGASVGASKPGADDDADADDHDRCAAQLEPVMRAAHVRCGARVRTRAAA